MEKNKDENIDDLLESQYGINAINEEYASDASQDDNRTSFEKEKDEELESKVIESKVQGNVVIKRNPELEDNNIKPEETTTKSYDYSDLDDVKEEKEKNNLGLLTFILSLVALVCGILYLIFSILYLINYKNQADVSTLNILLNIFRYTEIVFSVLTIVFAFIASSKKGAKVLIRTGIIIAVLTPVILILLTTLLPSMIK